MWVYDRQCAKEITQGVAANAGLKLNSEAGSQPAIGTPILGAPSATLEQAKSGHAAIRRRQSLSIWRQCAGVWPRRAALNQRSPTCNVGTRQGYLYRDGRSAAGIDALVIIRAGSRLLRTAGITSQRAQRRISAYLDHLALYACAPGIPEGSHSGSAAVSVSPR